MPPLIVARDLHKCYPGFPPVLRGVNIDVEAGELVAIMGPSGCGKSTMLHILGMLHKPDSGSLQILDTDILPLNREQTASFRRGNMGFVMQSSNLFDHSTVFENVEFPLIYEKIPPEERWERVIRALDLVRLSRRVHYRSNRLSGGEQQRVAIARAMVNSPRILLADEPTGALDAKTSRLIMENFRSLCHTGGVSMVMVTHDPKMADFCDSVYTLEEGILVCHKHEIPTVDSGGQSLLDPPRAVARGALVAERFPEKSSRWLVEQARILHAGGMLSRIYTLSGTSLLGNPEDYTLPLAIRGMGKLQFFQLFSALLGLLRHSPGTLWQVWKSFPLSRRWGPGFFRLLRLLACGSLLARWCIEEKIAWLHAAGAGDEATVCQVASRLLGLPMSMAVRCHQPGKAGPEIIALLQQASLACCDTEQTSKSLQEKFASIAPGSEIDWKKLMVLPDPLSLVPITEDSGQTEREAPHANPQGGFGENRPLAIVVAGSLNAHKGHATLLRACARLAAENIPFSLSIAGLGPKKWSLRLLAFRLGLGRKVNFAGQLGQEALADLLAHSDVLVAPDLAGDHQNGLPAAIVEAMASGLAVVASDLPGIAGFVSDGKDAILVPAADPESLAAALKKLASDTGLRRQLGNAAREKAGQRSGLAMDSGAYASFRQGMEAAIAARRSGNKTDA